ncbi:hypothetical protein [Phascolarctobacterium sp.]
MKSKIIYFFIVILMGINIFLPSQDIIKEKTDLLNVYVSLPTVNNNIVLIPEMTRRPYVYTLYRNSDFDLNSYLIALQQDGWIKSKQYKEKDITYYIYYKDKYRYVLRVYDDGRWGDGISYGD